MLCCRVAAIEALPEAWASLPAARRDAFLTSLLRTASADHSASARRAAQAAVAAVHVTAAHLAAALAPLATLDTSAVVAALSPAKRRKTAGDESDDESARQPAALSDALAATAPALEALQWLEGVSEPQALVAPLQACLQACAAVAAGARAAPDGDAAAPTEAPVAFAHALALSALRRIVSQLPARAHPPCVFSLPTKLVLSSSETPKITASASGSFRQRP